MATSQSITLRNFVNWVPLLVMEGTEGKNKSPEKIFRDRSLVF
jgi:hypothetical protein